MPRLRVPNPAENVNSRLLQTFRERYSEKTGCGVTAITVLRGANAAHRGNCLLTETTTTLSKVYATLEALMPSEEPAEIDIDAVFEKSNESLFVFNTEMFRRIGVSYEISRTAIDNRVAGEIG
jgi:hypothetical protein